MNQYDTINQLQTIQNNFILFNTIQQDQESLQKIIKKLPTTTLNRRSTQKLIINLQSYYNYHKFYIQNQNEINISSDKPVYKQKSEEYKAKAFKLQQEFLKITQIYPENQSAYFYLGELEIENPIEKAEYYKLCNTSESEINYSLLSTLKLAHYYRETYEVRKKYYEQAKQLIEKWQQEYPRMDVKDFIRKYFSEIEFIEILSNLYTQNEALSEYYNFVKKYPGLTDNYQALFTLAHIYYDHYEFKAAKRIFKQSLRKNSQNYQTYFKLGYIYSEKGDEERAIEHYDRALDIFPKYLNALLNKGVSLQNLGKPLEAFETFSKCLEVDANYSKAYLNMGGLYSDSNQNAEAIFCFQKCLEYDNKDIKALNNIGICYSNLQRQEEAIQSYKRCIELNKNYYKAYINLGISYEATGQYQNAMEVYQQNIKHNPGFYRSYLLLGNLYLKQQPGSFKKARDLFEQGIKLNPGKINEIESDIMQEIIPRTIKLKEDYKLTTQRLSYQSVKIKQSCLWKRFRKEINQEIQEFLSYGSTSDTTKKRQSLPQSNINL